MTKGLVVVEGHGENEAAKNLITRLWQHIGLDEAHVGTKVYRLTALNTEAGLKKACELARAERFDKLLILRDEDDKCPKDSAPESSAWTSKAHLEIPAAIVLLHREFETLFLSCLHLIAGKDLTGPTGETLPSLLAGTTFDGNDFESVRGVKEWLSRRYPPGKKYKPTAVQLAFTRLLDFDVLAKSGLPCFGSLVRALQFLNEQRGHAVYP